MADAERFRLGRLDHVHVYVPDLAEAAAWYSTHLGFEPVERFGFWAHGVDGGPLTTADLVDFDLCWAFDFVDPWGNRFEFNCYDHDRVRSDLVVTSSIVPDRKWPADLYERYVGTSNQRDPNHSG